MVAADQSVFGRLPREPPKLRSVHNMRLAVYRRTRVTAFFHYRRAVPNRSSGSITIPPVRRLTEGDARLTARLKFHPMGRRARRSLRGRIRLFDGGKAIDNGRNRELESFGSPLRILDGRYRIRIGSLSFGNTVRARDFQPKPDVYKADLSLRWHLGESVGLLCRR